MLLSILGCSGEKKDSSLTLNERVQKGVHYLQVFNFKAAYETLSSVQPILSQDNPDWELATYSLGLAAWHKTPPTEEATEQAKGLFLEVIEANPMSEYAASAMLDLGRIAEIKEYRTDVADVDTAKTYYERVRNDFPNSDMSARATVFLAQVYAQDFTDKASVEYAIELLKAELKAQPDSAWRAVMAQYTAHLYMFYLDDPQSSLEYFQITMDEGFPRAADTDVSLWQYGLVADQANEPILAASILTRIVEEYPRSFFGTLAREKIIEIAKQNPNANIEIPELQSLSLGR